MLSMLLREGAKGGQPRDHLRSEDDGQQVVPATLTPWLVGDREEDGVLVAACLYVVISSVVVVMRPLLLGRWTTRTAADSVPEPQQS